MAFLLNDVSYFLCLLYRSLFISLGACTHKWNRFSLFVLTFLISLVIQSFNLCRNWQLSAEQSCGRIPILFSKSFQYCFHNWDIVLSTSGLKETKVLRSFRLWFVQVPYIDRIWFVPLWFGFDTRKFPQHCKNSEFCSFNRFMFNVTVCFQMIKSGRWSSCFSCQFSVLFFLFTCWKNIFVVCVVNWVHETFLVKISKQDCTTFQLTYDLQRIFKFRKELEHFAYVRSVQRTDISIRILGEPSFNYSTFKILWLFNPPVY